jgi:hypothetical protein
MIQRYSISEYKSSVLEKKVKNISKNKFALRAVMG